MSTPLYPASGGWPAYSQKKRVTIGPDLAWLASEKYTVKRGGITLKKAAASATQTDEVQTLATSTATGGTFKLSFKGEQTSALAFNASAATIQTALRALSTIGAAGVSVTGGAANAAPVVITFAGSLGGTNQPLIETDVSALTGGTTTGVTETTRGSAANVSEVLAGTFVVPDSANPGYYKVYVSGTINDYTDEVSGFTMQSVNLADGDVTVGLLIEGSVMKERIQPYPLPANAITAIAGRIVVQ